MTRFGPAGNEQGSTLEAPKWLREEMGLSALEVQFGRGVRISEGTARKIGAEAKKYDIEISAHAPYFINLAKDESFDNNYRYIKSTIEAVGWMGGHRIVVHAASQGDFTREVAVENTARNLLRVVEKLETEGFSDFLICIETMGKYKQIGNLEEIVNLSKLHPNIIPCVDFGHLNCLMQGELQRNPDKIIEIMNYLGDGPLHIHWSAIEFGSAGEIRHTILDDTQWAFDFSPLARILKNWKHPVTIICESKNKMATDAKKLLQEFVAI